MNLGFFPVLVLVACTPGPGPDRHTGVPADSALPPDDTAPSPDDTDPDGDGWDVATDCDDTDPTVHPGAAEACDGRDQDCDGAVDEGLDATWYQDADGDGWGDPRISREACTAPSGWLARAGDCDDADARVHPDAEETCDGQDDDCDGTVDEASAADAPTWYADTDADGWGTGAPVGRSCDVPPGTAGQDGDCDDASATVHPTAPEVCDGVDQDCDGTVDEGVTTTFYADDDDDGFGDAARPVRDCTCPASASTLATDCDDGDEEVHPGATETCDGTDEDCDALVDEGAGTLWYLDLDGDGAGDPTTGVRACTAPAGRVSAGGDCDDTDPDVGPGTLTWETPGDGVDQDCDGWDGCTDLDCDALPDLIVPALRDNADWDATTKAWFDGPAGFPAAVDLPGTGVSRAAVADLDGDGFQDVVLGSLGDGTSYSARHLVYWGTATGPDPTSPTVLPGDATYAVHVEDLDRDGWPDILVPSYRSSTSYATSARIWWGAPTGLDPTVFTDLPVTGGAEVAVADLDEDGFLDLAIANHYDGSSYDVDSLVYWGSAAGFSAADVTALPTHGAHDVLALDLDRDGWTDLVFPGFASSSYGTTSYYTSSSVYWGSARGFDPSDRLDLVSYGSVAVDHGDLDDDGYEDLVFAGWYYYGLIPYTTVFLSRAGWTAPSFYFAFQGIADVAVDDLDADGVPDLVLAQSTTGSSFATASVILWGQRITWSPWVNYSQYSSSLCSTVSTRGSLAVTVSDVDRDGWSDLLFSSYQEGSTDFETTSPVWWGDAAGFGSSTELPSTGVLGPIVVIGD